jgi:hypothetical protein
MTACARCDENPAPAEVALLDDGGASKVDLCPECRGALEAERCRSCGDRRRNADVFVVAGGEKLGVCRDCRDLLLTDKSDRQEADVCN